MSMDSIIKQIMAAMPQQPKTSAYDTQATVRRIEDGVAWVHIPGGVDETPVRLTVNARSGDTVQVRVSGGRAFLVGNQTAPPTDDTKANKVGANLTATQKVVKAVKATAEKASRIATSTAQYFWVSTGGTDNGAHVTSIPQSEFEADPQNGGGNTLLTTNGVAVRDGLTELATFSADGVEFGDEHGKHVSINYNNETAQTSVTSDILLAVMAQNEASTPTGSTIESGGCASDFGSLVTKGSRTPCVGWLTTSAGYSNVPNVGEEGIARAKMQASSINKTAFVDAVADDSDDLSRIGVFADNFTFTKNEVDYYPAIVKQTYSATGISSNTFYHVQTFNISKTDYTPIAVNVRINQAAIYCSSIDYTNQSAATVSVAHRTNNTISNLNLYLEVTYARNELL